MSHPNNQYFTNSGLDPKGDLSIAEIAVYAPLLLITIYVITKHSFSLGWWYICILCVLRLLGASILLYVESMRDYSVGLITAAAICSAIGIAPLTLSLLGFLEKMNAPMYKAKRGGGLSSTYFLPFHIVPLAGLALAVSGAVLQEENTVHTKMWNTGHALFEAASILFFVLFLALAVITFLTYTWRNHLVYSTDKNWLYASLLSLPFICVRMVYFIVIAFAGPNSKFYYYDVTVYGQAFMQFMVEAIVIIIYNATAIMTPPRSKSDLVKPEMENGQA